MTSISTEWVETTIRTLGCERNRLGRTYGALALRITIGRCMGIPGAILISSGRDLMEDALLIDKILSVLDEDIRVVWKHHGAVEISRR